MVRAPKVTIAIPTYRRPDLLRQCVAGALAQTVGEIEVLVSDNGNDGEVAEVVASFGDVRVMHAPLARNIGMAANMTRCLYLGTAPYVKVLQDDDVLMPDSIEHTLLRFERDPALTIVHSAHRVIDASGKLIEPFANWSGATSDWEMDGKTFIWRSLSSGVLFHISTALIRRDALRDDRFEDVGGYNDLALWLRMAARGARFAYVHRPLVAIREHASSESVRQGLHVVGIGDMVNTQTLEQTRQMQDVRRAFLLHEGYALPDRSALWSAARRDARRQLARVVLKDFLAHRSLRGARAQLKQAREIDAGMRVWSLVAFAAAPARIRKVVRVFAERLGLMCEPNCRGSRRN
jgi:cellulose synthase/poly-beta-1,6-N-acetylglucosamine synthase-like glycosyltransferase